MVTDFGIDDDVRRHHVLVVQIIRYKLLGCLQVFYRLARHGDAVKDIEKSVRTHRLIAPRRRGLHRAFAGSEFRTFESLFTDGLAGDGIRSAFQKMIDIIEAAQSEFDIPRFQNAWSKVDDYQVYLNYQKALRTRISDCPPLRWEFRTWPQMAQQKS